MTRCADTALMKALALALIVTLFGAPSAFAETDDCAESESVRANKLVAPIVAEEGRLAGYAFLTPRVCLARSYSALDFHEKEHVLTDALVRAVQRSPLRLLPDSSVDRSDAEAAFREALAAVYGPGDVTAIGLQGDDFRLMRR